MYNYTWAHSGMWTVVRSEFSATETRGRLDRKITVDTFSRRPPSHAYSSRPKKTCSTISRRHVCRKVHHLPHSGFLLLIYSVEYGGSLPPIRELQDPIRAVPTPPMSPVRVRPPSPEPSSSSLPRTISRLIAPTSHLNPFFGYPTSRSSNSLYTPKRTTWQLIRTLVVLLWKRWGGRLRVLMMLLLAVFAARRVSWRLRR
jgi:hypothetical protein